MRVPSIYYKNIIASIPVFFATCLMGLGASLAGCSHIGLYYPNVQQGNVYTSQDIAKLKVGMTREQVGNVLGTPVLMGENNQEAVYLYTLREHNRLVRRKSVTIAFNQNQRVANITYGPEVGHDIIAR